MKYAVVTGFFWRERQRQRQRERQTETETQTDRQADRQTDRETEILFFSQELVIFLPHS